MTEENAVESNETPNTAQGSGRRKLILLFVLIAVLGLFAYDQFVTKSDFNDAIAELNEMQNLVPDSGMKKQGDQDGDGYITASDVKMTAGRDPSDSGEVGDSYLVETYSWNRIIPGMKYNAFVVYRKGGERNVLYRVVTEKPDASSLPKSPEVGEPGSVSNPVIGGLPPADQRPDRDPNSDGKTTGESASPSSDKKEDDGGSTDKKEDDGGSTDKKKDDGGKS